MFVSRSCPAPSGRYLRLLGLAFAATLALAAPDAYAQQGQAKKQRPFNVLPITITSVTPQAGQLVANGIIGSTPFQIPLQLTARPALSAAATCPILDLSLGPIHLSLLGLNVDTSAICLTLVAQQGGGLLGDLLCAVANLLNGGLDLGTILGNLTPQQLGTLDRGLTSLLNQAVFNPLTSSSAVTAASCNVLNLSLGPLHLELLGLIVDLNDCSAGPVTIDVTATPGGGLLGDLLCSLGNLLNNNGTGNQAAILQTLLEMVRLLGPIVG